VRVDAKNKSKKKQRVPLIVKLVVAVVAIYCVITYVDLQQRIQAGQAEGLKLEQTLQEQRQQNAALEQEVETELDNAAIAQMAREKLGLIFPGETVYFDVSN